MKIKEIINEKKLRNYMKFKKNKKGGKSQKDTSKRVK